LVPLNSLKQGLEIPLVNSLSGHKVPFHVVDNLIAVDIGVKIWDRNGLGIRIKRQGNKIAQHKMPGVKAEMSGGGS